MIILALPIMVNKDGTCSFFVIPSKSPTDVNFLEFFDSETATNPDWENSLPKGLIKDLSKIVIANVSHEDSDVQFYAFAGNHDDFDANYKEGGRWVAQGQIKFGPLPEGFKDYSKFAGLYTASLADHNFTALMLAMHAVRSLRAGVDFDQNDSTHIMLIARHLLPAAELMSSKFDKALPPLRSGGNPAALEPIMKLMGDLSAKIARGLIDKRSAELAVAQRRKGTSPKAA